MPTFRDVVNSRDSAFGVRTKDALRIQKLQSLKEGLMRIKTKAKDIFGDKYYVVPKSYKEVQVEAFFKGNVIFSPGYWSGMALWRYGFAAYHILHSHDVARFCSDLVTASVWVGLAAIALCVHSRKLVKKRQNDIEK